MYSQEGLRYAITGLFCSRMGEDGYTMQEAEEHLDKLDFSALLQAARNNARTVYAYTTQGTQEKSLTIAGRSCSDKRPPFCMKRTTRARWRSLSPPGRWSCGCWRT